jgi:hypothetical protein
MEQSQSCRRFRSPSATRDLCYWVRDKRHDRPDCALAHSSGMAGGFALPWVDAAQFRSAPLDPRVSRPDPLSAQAGGKLTEVRHGTVEKSPNPFRISSGRHRVCTTFRMDALYEDKLDGKITEEFWTPKQAEYSDQERSLETALSSLSTPITRDRVLTVQRIFELANKAHFLYVTRNHTERGQLLKSVLLNCATDGVNLWPTYRKPFDLIFQRVKNEEWSGRADLNCRPLAPQASALPG